MSRPAQIRFLSRFARVYDPVVKVLGFGPLWQAVAEVADPAPDEAVLDVCTGTGGAALELARRGASVTGLDLAGALLLHARRKWNGGDPRLRPRFVRMDAQRLAFRDGAFPLVTCCMGLHEMAEGEREQALREMVRVARDRLIIAEYRVPVGSLSSTWFRTTRFFEYIESDDFAQFVGRRFDDRLADAGLRVGAPRDVGAYRIWPCRTRGS